MVGFGLDVWPTPASQFLDIKRIKHSISLAPHPVFLQHIPCQLHSFSNTLFSNRILPKHNLYYSLLKYILHTAADKPSFPTR